MNPDQALAPEPRILGEGVRYAISAVIAAGVDLAVAWLVHAWLGTPLAVAAGAGVLAGGFTAYWLLEFWAFKRDESAFSSRRLTGLLGVVALTFGLRTVFVAAMALLFPAPSAALPILLTAFALTFCVNFAINRLVIFRREQT